MEKWLPDVFLNNANVASMERLNSCPSDSSIFLSFEDGRGHVVLHCLRSLLMLRIALQ